MIKEEYSKKDTGTRIKWLPDLEVFTDIDIPLEYFQDILKKQAVVNAGVRFILRNQVGKSFETYEYIYENGIEDYVKDYVGEEDAFTGIPRW
jgi:DNA gyrase subunit B